MKYIIISILTLSMGFASCNTANSKGTQSTDESTHLLVVREPTHIDTIVVVNDNIEEAFEDEWIDGTFYKLRKNEIPCEIIMVENNFSEIQDSMLVFTGEDFRYSYLKVTHLDKLILEYFEEDNLDNRTPMIDGVKEIGRFLADGTEIRRSGEYMIHATTELNTTDIFIGMNDRELTSMKYLGFVD